MGIDDDVAAQEGIGEGELIGAEEATTPRDEVDHWYNDVYPDSKIICGNFELKGGQFLGCGKDSITRQGTDTHTGRRVAIKRYDLRDNLDPEGNFRKWGKFISLVQAHGFMKHAHAVVLYCLDYSKDSKGQPGVDEEDYCCYLVLELGAFTLDDYLADRRKHVDGGLAMTEVLELFLCMTEIIAAIHREGCVHLNITPHAFMQTAEERKWKLYDVERIRKSNSSVEVTNSNITFDPLYMAPEFAISVRSSKVSVRVAQCMDMWSFGSLLAELLLKEPIFANVHNPLKDMPEYLHYLCDPKVEIPVEIRRFDIDFYNLIGEMLIVKPKDRVQIVDVMGSELYRKALNSKMDPRLEKELHLLGIRANKDRRLQMLAAARDLKLQTDFSHGITRPGCTSPVSPRRDGANQNPVTTIAQLRDSIHYTDASGRKVTKFVETPHGYDPHDYHDVDQFVETEEPNHPGFRIPPEPVLSCDTKLESASMDQGTFRSRISWNFTKKPLYENEDDLFYRFSKQKKEFGPFTAAQMRIWITRGVFSNKKVYVRKRNDESFQELANFMKEISDEGLKQLHSTEYSRLAVN